ncbi:hypothetical protein D3C77_316120 [compost metagenome]
MFAACKGIELLQRPRQRLGHDFAHDVAGGDTVPGVALAVPDIVGKLAQLRNAVDHDTHGTTPLELDRHALECREGALDARAQLTSDIPRVTA